MNAQTTQFDDLHLVALPSAVNCTELFVRFSLTEWSLRGLADDAAQAANALVSAAVEGANPDSPGFITVRVRLRGDKFVIEVEDERTDTSTPAPEVANGRTGVAALEDGRRLVWCELALPEGVTASAVPLPRREPKKSHISEQTGDETADIDPEVMERLLSGLSKGTDNQPE